jgi:RHS repeat-associated protein
VSPLEEIEAIATMHQGLVYDYGEHLCAFGPSLFTGKERDSESGNDYFGARYYGSSMGRFMSPDPSGLAFANPGNPQSLNLYSYALNNPLINIDPTGMECVWGDGSYDSADDPQTGNAAGCSGQGGTYVNPDLFENALLTNGQNANIQFGSWSGQANSTLASSWTTPSGTAYGSQWAAGQEVDDALGYFYGNGAKPTLIYNNNDPFTQSFKNSLGMQGILAGITRDCSATSGNAPVGTWEAFANTMIDGPYLKNADGSRLSGYYTPEAQMGGFTSTYSRSGGVVNITVTNPITLNSLALHATAPLGIPNPTSGHLGTVTQQLNITAPDPCQ